jgi:ABC-type lipoprotein release transport system permease subunit
MITLIKLAWRNLWRNKRRTLITVASVFVAIFLALLMRSVQRAMYDTALDNAVRLSTGHLQVHREGYWEDKTINKTMTIKDSTRRKIAALENVAVAAPRLESFALVSSGPQTKGAAVVGTDPEIENRLTNLREKVIEGSYLEPGGALVASGVAEYLKLGVGDTIVLLGQGYHGSTAAGAYPILGVFEYPMKELNNSMIYLALDDAQYLYAAPRRLTSLTLMLDDGDDLEETRKEVVATLGEGYETLPWQEMNRELVQFIRSDNVGGIIMLAILYVVVAFGVFGSIVMMTLERRKEFGVMVAVGLRKGKLATIVFFESIFVTFVGVVAGSVAAIPILAYFSANPIPLTGEAASAYEAFGFPPAILFSLDPGFFLNQASVTAVIALVAAVYPAFVVMNLQAARAMRA